MDKLEIRNTIRKNELESAKILDTIKADKREATAVEVQTLANYKEDNTELQKQLAELDKMTVRGGNVIKNGTDEESFSLLRAIREISEGNTKCLAHPLIKEGQEQARNAKVNFSGQIQIPLKYEKRGSDILAGTQYQGQEIVATQKFNLLGALYANTVLGKAGANFMTGLVNNGSIPLYSGTEVSWEEETGRSDNGGGTFSKVDISPKRLTAYLDVSRLFLLQDNVGAENLLISDIQKAILVKLENTIFGTAAGSTKQPVGLFYNASFVAAGSASWSGLVALETEVLSNNKTLNDATTAYILSPRINTAMKTTAKAGSYPVFLLDGGKINGYSAFLTSNMPSGLSGLTGTSALYGVAFADWSDLVVGQWGGIDLVVDNISQATKGNIRIVINTYFDAAFRRSVSYALGAMK